MHPKFEGFVQTRQESQEARSQTVEQHFARLLGHTEKTPGLLRELDQASSAKSIEAVRQKNATILRDSQALFLLGHADALEQGMRAHRSIEARAAERYAALQLQSEAMPSSEAWRMNLYFQEEALRLTAVHSDTKDLLRPVHSMSVPAYEERAERFPSGMTFFPGRVLSVRVRSFLAKQGLEGSLSADQRKHLLLESNDTQLFLMTEFEYYDTSRVTDPQTIERLRNEFEWLKHHAVQVFYPKIKLLSGDWFATAPLDPESSEYAEYRALLEQYNEYMGRYFLFELETIRLGVELT